MHYKIEANEDMSTAIAWKIFRNMKKQDDVNDICEIFVKNASTMTNYKRLQIDNKRLNFAIYSSHEEGYITILAMMCKLDPSVELTTPDVRLFSIFKKSKQHRDSGTLSLIKNQLQTNFTQKVAKMLPLYWFWTYFEKKNKNVDDFNTNQELICINDFEMVDEFINQSAQMKLLDDIDTIAPMVGQFKSLGWKTVSQFQDYVFEQKKGQCLNFEEPMSSPEENNQVITNNGTLEKIVQDLILVKLAYNPERKIKYLITMGHTSHMLCIKTEPNKVWIRIINPCHYVERSEEMNVDVGRQKRMHVQNIANLGIYHMWIDVIKMNDSALSSTEHRQMTLK